MMIATALHLTLCFVNFIYFGMGIKGLALASSIKDFVLFVTVATYSYFYVNDSLAPFDSESFKGWG